MEYNDKWPHLFNHGVDLWGQTSTLCCLYTPMLVVLFSLLTHSLLELHFLFDMCFFKVGKLVVDCSWCCSCFGPSFNNCFKKLVRVEI